MITGLQFDVKSNELQSLFTKQIEVNSKLAEDCEAYGDRLRSASPDNTAGLIGTVEQNRSHALARTEGFRWLSQHVIKEETYRLSISELSQVGIVQGFGADVALPQQMLIQRPVPGTEQRANA